jgi:hypothetical protein
MPCSEGCGKKLLSIAAKVPQFIITMAVFGRFRNAFYE